jgi:hypothetical protein
MVLAFDGMGLADDMSMSKHIALLFVVCIIAASLTFFTPEGLSVSLGSLFFLLLMLGCCVLPILLMVLGGSWQGGVCCGKKPKDESSEEKEPGKHSGQRVQPKSGCH